MPTKNVPIEDIPNGAVPETDMPTGMSSLGIKKTPPWYTQIPRYALPTATSVLGGLAGTAVSPVAGTMAGAALGGAAGEQLADLYEQYVLKTREEPGLGNRMVAAGTDIPMYGAAEALGMLMPGLASKAKYALQSPLRKLFAPPDMAEYMKNVAVQQRTGIPFMEADLTGNRPAQQIQQSLSQQLPTASLMQLRSQAIADATEEYGKKILGKLGGKSSSAEAGYEALTNITAREKAHRDITTSAYNEAEALLPPGTPMPTEITTARANDWLLKIGGDRVGNEDVYALVKRFAEGKYLFKEGEEAAPSTLLNQFGMPFMTPATPPAFKQFTGPTFANIQHESRALGDKIRIASKNGDRTKAAIYSDLKAALDRDMDAFAEKLAQTGDPVGSEFKSQYDMAKAIAAVGNADTPGYNIFRDEAVKNLVKRIEREPTRFLDMAVKSDNPNQANYLKMAMGTQAWGNVKRAALTDALSRGPEGTFSPDKFFSWWDKMDEAQKNVIFDYDRKIISQLDDLAKTSLIGQSSWNAVGNKSQSGTSMITYYLLSSLPAQVFGGTVGAISGGDLTAGTIASTIATPLSLYFTPRVVARIYLSKDGLQHMKTLASVGLQSPKAPAIMRRALQTAGVSVYNSKLGVNRTDDTRPSDWRPPQEGE